MDTLERATVRRIIGGSVFVKLAEGDDALLVSDAPRRMVAGALREAIDRLQAEGYVAWITERDLLAIDWDEKRWHAFCEPRQTCETLTIPSDATRHALYALARLLAAHPAPRKEQPLTLLRALVKAATRKDGLLKIAPAMLATCAVRLRQRETLPSAAAWLAVQALHKPCDGGEG